jgi:hypothetical protein
MDQISTELTKTEGKALISEVLKLIHSVGIRNVLQQWKELIRAPVYKKDDKTN